MAACVSAFIAVAAFVTNRIDKGRKATADQIQAAVSGATDKLTISMNNLGDDLKELIEDKNRVHTNFDSRIRYLERHDKDRDNKRNDS